MGWGGYVVQLSVLGEQLWIDYTVHCEGGTLAGCEPRLLLVLLCFDFSFALWWWCFDLLALLWVVCVAFAMFRVVFCFVLLCIVVSYIGIYLGNISIMRERRETRK